MLCAIRFVGVGFAVLSVVAVLPGGGEQFVQMRFDDVGGELDGACIAQRLCILVESD